VVPRQISRFHYLAQLGPQPESRIVAKKHVEIVNVAPGAAKDDGFADGRDITSATTVAKLHPAVSIAGFTSNRLTHPVDHYTSEIHNGLGYSNARLQRNSPAYRHR
jgi:hypothetical protein